jgi:hypothetical protein
MRTKMMLSLEFNILEDKDRGKTLVLLKNSSFDGDELVAKAILNDIDDFKLYKCHTCGEITKYPSYWSGIYACKSCGVCPFCGRIK